MRLQGKAAPITGGRSIELATARPFDAAGVVRTGRLFVLEMSGDRIHSMNPDGSDRKTIVTGCHLPDGIFVDAKCLTSPFEFLEAGSLVKPSSPLIGVRLPNSNPVLDGVNEKTQRGDIVACES